MLCQFAHSLLCKLSSCTSSCSTSWTALCLVLLHTAVKWFILPHSPYLFPYAGDLRGDWLDLQYLDMHVWLFCILCICPFSFSDQMALHSWSTLNCLELLFCPLSLYSPCPLKYFILCSMFVVFSFVISFIISTIMPLLINPCINCPFQLSICFFIIAFYSCYSKSAYPLFCIFVWCLTNLQNCGNFIVSLYSGLNVLLTVSKRHSFVWHASCSAGVRASKSCTPCLPS